MKPCDECGSNAANVHLTQVANGQTTVWRLCEECARKKGITISIATENAVPAQAAAPVAPAQDIECPSCKLRFSEFQSKGWLGCQQCYHAFEKEIDRLLVQVHGSCIHKGKRYATESEAQPVTPNPDLNRLRAELNKAVKDEEFELAAAIRDVIRGLAVGGGELQQHRG
jgi:protein arginine kinase activator